jgi:hypothetical protein
MPIMPDAAILPPVHIINRDIFPRQAKDLRGYGLRVFKTLSVLHCDHLAVQRTLREIATKIG